MIHQTLSTSPRIPRNYVHIVRESEKRVKGSADLWGTVDFGGEFGSGTTGIQFLHY